MKIAIYANELTLSGHSGVKTYTREIIRGLIDAEKRSDLSDVLKVSPRSEDNAIAQSGELNERGLTFEHLKGQTSHITLYASRDISDQVPGARIVAEGAGQRLWAFRTFPRLIERDRPDVVFVPIQVYPFLRKLSYEPKVVVTVHDAAFRLFTGEFTLPRRLLLDFHTRNAVRHADRIIVPSEATKQDIMRFYDVPERKLTVLAHGTADLSARMTPTSEQRVEELTKGDKYLLFVGTIQPRKNLIRLVEAFEGLREQPTTEGVKLVLCGARGWKYRPILERIARSSRKDAIVLTGRVEDGILASLYRHAEVLVLPSLYEGFGLPLVEAMGFGLPLIAADNSSLREVAGEAALYFPSEDAQGLRKQLEILLASPKLKAELSEHSRRRAAEFTWQKAAEATWRVLE